MRAPTACVACRHGKRQCLLSDNTDRKLCVRCERMRIPCKWEAPPLPQNEANTLRSLLESIELAAKEDIVWHYFTVVHDQHHSIFHRPTFEANLRRGSIPDIMLCCVLALGSRFNTVAGQIVPSTSKRRVLGDQLAKRAFTSLDMRDASIETIQTCVLLGSLCFVEGNIAAEATYYATAVRLAQVLDLPRRHSATELERQVDLRVWYTLYMTDVWVAGGLKLPRQFIWNPDHDLPAQESYFLSLAPDTLLASSPVGPGHSGIWGNRACLTAIWAKIQDLNKLSVEWSSQDPALVLEVDRLEQELALWHDSLPLFLQETKPNLERAASLGLGSSFGALFLRFHYYHQVLFYRFLGDSHTTQPSSSTTFPIATPSAVSRAAKCAAHARAFCDMLYLCESIPGCRGLYAMVGHMVVVTSTVLMHVLFFGQQQQQSVQLQPRGTQSPLLLPQSEYICGLSGGLAGSEPPHCIRQRLRRNYEILTEFLQHWSKLEIALERLKVFHNACYYSIEHSFDMDQWLLKFILEHGISMPEKFPTTPNGPAEAFPTADEGAGASWGNIQEWLS